MTWSDDCLIANNARDAFRIIKERCIIPDLVCVERNMTAVDGLEFLRMLKDIEYLKKIPVIVHSPAMEQADIDELRRMGATAILLKPNNFYSICTMLALFFGVELIAVCQN